MFNTKEDDYFAYLQGMIDCQKANHDPTKIPNPYPKDSIKWRSWNCGWNNYEE